MGVKPTRRVRGSDEPVRRPIDPDLRRFLLSLAFFVVCAGIFAALAVVGAYH